MDEFGVKPHFTEGYLKHKVFNEIKYMIDFYESLSYNCSQFSPNGTLGITNYASYVFSSIGGTLDSIRTVLRIGRINDGYSLIRKLYDDVLTGIYFNVVRVEKFDPFQHLVVKDVDDWLRRRKRIPELSHILNKLKTADCTKDLYPYFEWDSSLTTMRGYLNDNIHANCYQLLLLNCNQVFLPDREKHLDKILSILDQIFTIHLAFTFYINSCYMVSDDYISCLESGTEPPEDSQYWIAPFAQDAFDKFIKPQAKLASFIKSESSMQIM